MPTERTYPRDPLALALGRVVLAPLQWFVSGEEFLRLNVNNSVVGVTVTLAVRTLGDNNRVQASTTDLVPTADRLLSTIELFPGFTSILTASVFVKAGSPLVGQTFAAIDLIRGSGSAAVKLARLTSGYVTANQAIAYPGSPVVPATSGEPVLRQIVGTAPGVNAQVLETVPTGARWELMSFAVDCTNTGGGATNVTPILKAIGPPNHFVTVPTATAFNIAAGATIRVSWGEGAPNVTSAAGTDNSLGWPVNHRLLAGMQLQIPAPGTGVQYSAPRYLVREWQEGS